MEGSGAYAARQTTLLHNMKTFFNKTEFPIFVLLCVSKGNLL